MSKQKSKPQATLKYRSIVIVAVSLAGIIVLSLCVKLILLQPLIDDWQLAELAPLRQQIIQAVEGSAGIAAPVDPRSGDIYFPQAKLYLPNPPLVSLTYFYNPQELANQELIISDRNVLGEYSAQLYNARNTEELFKVVPKLQACQRGVSVVYSNSSPESGAVLQATVQLNNGKTLYIFADNQCPELSNTVTLLKKLQAF